MKSISKRIISFALSVFMLICVSINLSAFESEYQRGLAVLHSAGWSDEDISDLLTYDVVCGYAGLKLVNTNQTYYRVTEDSSEPITKEECLADLTASDSALYIPSGNPMISPLAHGDTWKNEVTTTDGYLTYFVQVYDAGSGIYVISGRYEWIKTPFTTLTDSFAVGWRHVPFPAVPLCRDCRLSYRKRQPSPSGWLFRLLYDRPFRRKRRAERLRRPICACMRSSPDLSVCADPHRFYQKIP